MTLTPEAIIRLGVEMRIAAEFTRELPFPTPSGTSNHGRNHVSGRLDEWGGSSNPFRGTNIGKTHSPAFELWMMGFPAEWGQLMPLETPLSRKSQRHSSAPTPTHGLRGME
jgi:hypothetical protein